MPYAYQLQNDVLDKIAAGIADRPTAVAKQTIASGGLIELAESFPVYMIELSATTRADEELQALAIPTGLWHHQIRHDGRALEFARSQVYGPEPTDWRIEEISTSPIAGNVEKAIEWIDNHLVEEAPVAMIVVPTYFIHVLWVQVPQSDKVVVADKPDQYQKITYETAYTSKQFLEILAQMPHIVGIPPPCPNPC